MQPPWQRGGPVVQEHRAKLPDEGIRLAVHGVGQHPGQRPRGVAGQKWPPSKKPVRHFVCGRAHLFPPGCARSAVAKIHSVRKNWCPSSVMVRSWAGTAGKMESDIVFLLWDYLEKLSLLYRRISTLDRPSTKSAEEPFPLD